MTQKRTAKRSVRKAPIKKTVEKKKEIFLGESKWYLKPFEWIQTGLKFLFTKYNPKENIFMYAVRQFMLPDSSGNPSLTVTILFFVMGIIGLVTYIETKIALTYKIASNPDGSSSMSLHGFSEYFYWLLISLAGIVITYFNSREKRRKGESTMYDTVVNKIKDKIGMGNGPFNE